MKVVVLTSIPGLAVMNCKKETKVEAVPATDTTAIVNSTATGTVPVTPETVNTLQVDSTTNKTDSTNITP